MSPQPNTTITDMVSPQVAPSESAMQQRNAGTLSANAAQTVTVVPTASPRGDSTTDAIVIEDSPQVAFSADATAQAAHEPGNVRTPAFAIVLDCRQQDLVSEADGQQVSQKRVAAPNNDLADHRPTKAPKLSAQPPPAPGDVASSTTRQAQVNSAQQAAGERRDALPTRGTAPAATARQSRQPQTMSGSADAPPRSSATAPQQNYPQRLYQPRPFPPSTSGPQVSANYQFHVRSQSPAQFNSAPPQQMVHPPLSPQVLHMFAFLEGRIEEQARQLNRLTTQVVIERAMDQAKFEAKMMEMQKDDRIHYKRLEREYDTMSQRATSAEDLLEDVQQRLMGLQKILESLQDGSK